MEGLINKMKNIHRDPSLSPRGLAPGTVKKTSSKRHIPGGLLPGHGRMRSGHQSSGGIAASPASLINKRLTLPFLAFVAVLAAGLLFLLPGGPLHSQEAMTELEYTENGMDPVATFTAVDPEGRTVYWSVLMNADDDQDIDGDGTDDVADTDIADHGDFSISADGVLTFKSPPNYEKPRGGAADNSGCTDGAIGDPCGNTYNVVVVSSDDVPGATTDGETPESDGSNLPKMSYHKVTVEVTDVDEDGSVSLSTLQPQAGTALNVAGTANDDTDDAAATLKDQDASTAQITAAKWKWEQSSAMDGPWTLISGETSPSYTPAADVVGMYVRLTATYNDKHGDDKTAMATSAHPVRKAPAGGNSPPEFSAGDTDTRRVKENSPSGTAVGKPVTAGDAGDVLTYMLAGDDMGSFSIDRASGQIMTKASLNLEAGLTDRVGDTDGIQLQVTVRATDPYGDPDVETAVITNSATITVYITVDNVNEAPRFTVGPTRDKQKENEDTNTTNEDVDIPTLAYAVTDVDDDDIEWSLMGADKDAFGIEKDATTLNDATSSAMVKFKKSPNYEKPTDTNMDNMYMVTVVATDKKKLTATRDVVITVTNADDPGKITFSSEQPKVRIDFTATLADEDGGVDDEKVKWQWRMAEGSGNPLACPDNTDFAAQTAVIDGAKSDTYTPVKSPTSNVGQCLQATATYTDSNGSGKTTSKASAKPVVDNLDNALPEFKEGGDKPVMQATRYIIENAGDDATVVANLNGTTAVSTSDQVMAIDPNGAVDVLTYTLGGRDKDSFDIASDTGRITVKTGTKLDYEKKNSYMVTVTATDPSLAFATIDVTINVVDVNEPPEIAGEDGTAKEFRENSTSTIQTFSAKDPEGRQVYWSIGIPESLPTGVVDADHADNARFTISSSGALKFTTPPDYERPKGADIAEDNTNTYKVVVFASDDASNIGEATYTDTAKISGRKFTVQVTNASETGEVTIDRRYPQVNVQVEATLMDGDATNRQIIEATEWKWYKGSSVIGGQTTDTFTPIETGTHKVEILYTAKGDSRKASKTFTVQAAPTGDNAAAEPAFESNTLDRSVDEGKANANVGDPIRATDATPGDSGKLTYTVNPDTHFSITNTGQLKTKMALDSENLPGDLSLEVTATDPSGTSGDNNPVTVTITINDVNEAPTITGPTRALPKDENTPTDVTDTDAVVAVYTATDPETDEATDLKWSLSGTDASDFYIGNQTGGTPGTLTFKEKPDYEKPAASNNLYRVTVEVSDGKLKATRLMTVMVEDMEEAGEVTLSTVAPRVAVELTASLKDSDGGVTDVTWQWWKTTATDAQPAPTFPDPDSTTGVRIGWEKIDDAESDTYEPVVDDIGRWLIANASYTDRRGEGKTAMGQSDNAVIVNNDNRAPMFKENDVEITETTRKVAENVDAGTLFGDGMDDGSGPGADNDTLDNEEPVKATDPNDDNLTYTLSGTDEASFDIERGTGQLKTKAKLDYETKSSYMVTVTATDPHGLSDSVDVTIKVTDMDEAPKIIVGGLVVTGTGDINYAENGMGMVATYSPAGPDAANATWSLSGADAGDLSISSAGVLTFNASPNYESPADANTDNIYMVMVNANDGTNDAMKAVTVRVTNEEEMGEVTLWAGTDALTMAPQVGDTITGAVMDPDGGETVETWQWAKTMTPDMMDSWMDINGATDAAYMVMEGDTGYYLRVMATYTDAMGTDMATEYSMPTMMVTSLAISGMSSVEYAENGMGAVETYMAAGPDAAMASWTLSGDDAGDFMISGGMLTFGSSPDYENPMDADMDNVYMVTIMANDGTNDAMKAVTVMVTNEEETGVVTLWAGADALTMAPQVGDTITGAVMDPDGGVTGETWQWAKTMTPDMMDSWMPIQGATDAAYMVTADDTGYYLQVMATYMDAMGTDDMAMEYSMPTMMVTSGDTELERLVAEYDQDSNSKIERGELIDAIDDYLFGSWDDQGFTKTGFFDLIEFFLFG